MAHADLNHSHTEVPCWRRGTDLVDLVEIFDPEVQVCSVRREIDPAISSYLSSLQQSAETQSLSTLVAGEQPMLEVLPEAPGKSSLLTDLALLRDIVCELLDCQSVGMRLARLGHAMCPGWHVDRLGIRLVCTYQGPGTHWLESQDVDRGALKSESVKNRDYVQADPAEIVLLKGSMWQGNERFGAVHRSPDPDTTAQLRTVVTLDTMR